MSEERCQGLRVYHQFLCMSIFVSRVSISLSSQSIRYDFSGNVIHRLLYRRDSCSGCLSVGDECVWCETTQTCSQFAPFLAVSSFGQCQSWVESHQSQGTSFFLLPPLSMTSCVSVCSNVSVVDIYPAGVCTACSDHSTCSDCLQDSNCGWCGNDFNPLIGLLLLSNC